MQSPESRPRSVTSSTTHRSITLWLLRILAVCWLVQIMAQIILAAEFVSGDVGMFEAHSVNGSTLSFLPLVMFVVAIIHATAARGIRWPILVTGLAWLATYVQEILGYARVLAAHIVGGTVLLGVAVALVVLLWRRRYTPRPRRERAQRGGTPPAQASGAAVPPSDSGPSATSEPDRAPGQRPVPAGVAAPTDQRNAEGTP